MSLRVAARLVRLVRAENLSSAHLGSRFHEGRRIFGEVAGEVRLFALPDDSSLVTRGSSSSVVRRGTASAGGA